MKANEAALARRIEEASLNAWPALHQVLLDGWVLRFAGGFTRRANSVTPLYPATQSKAQMAEQIAEKVAYCETLYAQESLPCLFRLATVPPHESLDGLLADRCYEREGEANVLQCPISPNAFRVAPGFALVPLPSFLATYGELSGIDGDLSRRGIDPQTAMRLHGTVLRAIRPHTAFGVVFDAGAAMACGMAVVERDLAGLFDIVTRPAARRRGYGRLLTRSLLAHAAASGAKRAYLQVLADNAPAMALYEQLGFAYSHRYWFRAQPQSGGN